ncbi:MAG: response regulator [bacterium]
MRYRHSFTIWILILVGNILSGVSSWAKSPIELNAGFESVYLRSELEFLEDPAGSVTFEQVLSAENLSRFQPNGAKVFNRGNTSSVYWLRFSVANPTADSIPLIFRIENIYGSLELYGVKPTGERFSVFKKSARQLVKEGGTTWDLQNTAIGVDANQQTDYYLRIEPNLILRAEISLWKPEALREDFTDKYNLLSISWGFISCNAFFSLLFFFFLRDTTYLFYGLHLLFFLFHRMFTKGWWITDFPSLDWFNWVRIYVIGLSIITVLLFFSKVLNLKEKSLISYKIIRAAIYSILGISFLVVWFEPNQAFRVFMLLSAISTLFLLIPYRAWRTGNQNALFYSFGWGILCLSTLIGTLNAMGFLVFPTSVYFVMELGAFLESLLFSIALAFRVPQNVEERQRAQELLLQQMQETERFKNQFLANTSHELRTPLHGIMGLAENLLTEARQRGMQQMSETLHLMIQSGRRLNLLISNLLDLTALREHRLNVNPELCYLQPIVRSAVDLINVQFSAKNIRIENQVSEFVLPVYGDPSRIEQVLLNLLYNACKFTSEGRVQIRSATDDENLRTEIHDSGPGVKDGDHQLIFEAFEQENPTMTEGLGLGLSISKEIIEEHGGQIGVEPSPLGGACFWFSLPLAQPAQIPLTENENNEKVYNNVIFQGETSAGTKQSEGTSILIVDDDPVNLHILTGMLSETDWSFTCCSSGREALELISQNASFSLVLLDLMMDGMDGIELCTILRQRFTKADLPILFLTALSRAEELTQAFEAGANDYLTKPIQKAELKARISSQLELSELRHSASQISQADSGSMRDLLAQTMQVVIECWEHCQGKDQISLAQESKLWGAYLDKTNGVWRSPGIRQYLSASSMPQRPRWRKVAQTVEFLQSQLSPDDPHRQQLSELLREIFEKSHQEDRSSSG